MSGTSGDDLKTEPSQVIPKTEKAEKESDSDQIDVSDDSKKCSARKTVSSIGSGFFSLSEESTELNKRSSEIQKKVPPKEKPKKEEKQTLIPTRLRKKSSFSHPPKEGTQGRGKRGDRDFRRFKSKYNTSVANIMRDWIGLIYCILILRMNLIKLILQKLPDLSDKEFHLSNQIMLESKTLHTVVKQAQNFSQEQFVVMWNHLEKLILSRNTIKKALQAIQMKESVLRDWRTAAAKLAQLQQEYEKAKEVYYDSVKKKVQAENNLKEKVTKLENLATMKDEEYDGLLEKIQQLKKKEVQMKAKILVNMKSYKDLKAKKQCLINVEKDVDLLKSEQSNLVKEYTLKVQSLKSKIEEKEKQIKVELEEKKNLKAHLEEFGGVSETQNTVTLKN